MGGRSVLSFRLGACYIRRPTCIKVGRALLSSPQLSGRASITTLLTTVIRKAQASNVGLVTLFSGRRVKGADGRNTTSVLLRSVMGHVCQSLNYDRRRASYTVCKNVLLSISITRTLRPGRGRGVSVAGRPILKSKFYVGRTYSRSCTASTGTVKVLQRLYSRGGVTCREFIGHSSIHKNNALKSITSALFPIHAISVKVPLLSVRSTQRLVKQASFSTLTSTIATCFS